MGRGQNISADAILYGDTPARDSVKPPLLSWLWSTSQILESEYKTDKSTEIPAWDSVATTKIFAGDIAAVWVIPYHSFTMVERDFNDNAPKGYKSFTFAPPNDKVKGFNLYFPNAPLEEIRTDTKKTIIYADNTPARAELTWSEAMKLLAEKFELGLPYEEEMHASI